MSVNAISSVLYQKSTNKTSKEKAKSFGVSYPATSRMQSAGLVDYNYGKALLANNINKVSFKGNVVGDVTKLSKIVSTAFSNLGEADILLMGKDLNAAKAHLLETLQGKNGLVEKLIKKVIFVKDDSLGSSIMLKKSSTGFDEVVNLTDTPVFIRKNVETSSKVALKRGDRAAIMGDTVVSKGPYDNGFSVSSEFKTDYTELPPNFMNQYYISEGLEPVIKEANFKNLQKIEDKSKDTTKVIKFADVGGQDEAIAEIKRKIMFQVKYPNFFSRYMNGGHGALFVGPPGNGKSLTAQALANELGIPFFNINGQLLESEFVGKSAKNINEYYEQARKNQPCIMFFDEADAMFAERTGVHKYADQSVNMHLDEISKLEKENAQVYLIAATNHPEIMDKAALRRFDSKIEFSNLDTAERCKAVFDVHTKNCSIENFDSDSFMQKLKTADMSGCDIANLVREAKMNSILRQGIFDQMEKGTFHDNPEFNLVLKGDDFESALKSLQAQRKVVGGEGAKKKNKIGFIRDEK